MPCSCTPSTDFEPIIQGADYAYDLEVSEIPEGSTEASPVDLTGAVFRAQLRKTASSPNELVNFVPSITDGLAGKVSFSLSHTATADLPPTPCETGWAHDVFADLADGRTLCLIPLTYLAVTPSASKV